MIQIAAIIISRIEAEVNPPIISLITPVFIISRWNPNKLEFFDF